MFPFFRAFRPWASIAYEGARIIVQESGVKRDRTAFLHTPSQFSFSQTLRQRGTATIPFRVPPRTFYDPQIGWPVWIYEIYPELNQSICRFVGTIFNRQKDWRMGQDGWVLKTLTLTSLEEMFDNVPCPQIEFENVSTDEIFTQLINYAISTGLPVPVTLGTVSGGVAVIDRKYDEKTSVGAAVSQLATDDATTWYVDPTDQKVYKHARDSRPAAFTLTSEMIDWQTLQYKQSKGDFRDRQPIQLTADILPPSNAVFEGDGTSTVLTLPAQAQRVTSAFITTSIRAHATGTLSGNMSAGDTISIVPFYSPHITPPDYVIVNVLDNTEYGQILRGATAADTTLNIVDAINGNPAKAGLTYSAPTWNNQQVTADQPIGTTFVLRATMLGVEGNTIGISKSSANFAWSAPELAGGLDRAAIPLTVGALGAGDFQLNYVVGSANVQLAEPVGVGVTLSINYRPVGAGFITVRNVQAAALAIQTNFQLMVAQNVKTAQSALQQAAAALAAYSKLPGEFSFSSIKESRFYPGHLLPVNILYPLEAGADLNGDWLIQEIQATWVPGMEGQRAPFGHFRYQVSCINTTEISTFVDTLNRLADLGPTNNQALDQGAQQPQPNPYITTIYSRSFLLKDSTVGNDIADLVPVLTPLATLSPVTHAAFRGVRIVAICRVTPTADLTVRINKTSAASPSTTVSWTVTIPSGSSEGSIFETLIDDTFNDLDTFSADVVASDGLIFADGYASFTVSWG